MSESKPKDEPKPKDDSKPKNQPEPEDEPKSADEIELVVTAAHALIVGTRVFSWVLQAW